MQLTTEESNGAVTGTHHHPQSAEQSHDTVDGEGAVSPGSTGRVAFALSPSSGETFPHEHPEN